MSPFNLRTTTGEQKKEGDSVALTASYVLLPLQGGMAHRLAEPMAAYLAQNSQMDHQSPPEGKWGMGKMDGKEGKQSWK